jgi:transposase
MSSDRELFEGLPEQHAPAPVRGAPRLRVPQRDQIDTHWAALDGLLDPDHPVRLVWTFVQGLDLTPLYDAIKAREGEPGHPPAMPELMMALWLWATVEDVGSARRLDQLCKEHLAYRWLCGGVSMNYHTLSNFYVAHRELLEKLLAGGFAALVEQGLVAPETLAQDGLRVRASAGAASFRAIGSTNCTPRRSGGCNACARNSRMIRAWPIGAGRRRRSAQRANGSNGSPRRKRACVSLRRSGRVGRRPTRPRWPSRRSRAPPPRTRMPG